jgi:hypothetical protein
VPSILSSRMKVGLIVPKLDIMRPAGPIVNRKRSAILYFFGFLFYKIKKRAEVSSFTWADNFQTGSMLPNRFRLQEHQNLARNLLSKFKFELIGIYTQIKSIQKKKIVK